MPKRRGYKKHPKKPTLTQRQKAAKLLGVNPKSLSTSRRQRKARHAMLEKAVGYRIPKLSTTVGVGGKPGKASRYTVKKRVINYKTVSTKPKTERVWQKAYPVFDAWGFRKTIPIRFVEKTVQVPDRKVAIGERLVVKKHSKRKKRTSGGSGGERVSHRTGTAQSRRSAAKKSARVGGKRGGKPKRKKKKK